MIAALPLITLGVTFATILTALAAEEDKIPPLKPAREVLGPSYWEQHGWLIIACACAGVALLGLLILWLRRAKPVAVTPPQLVARRALEGLRSRAEDDALVAEVSRIFRQYLHFGFDLPPDEFTTPELAQALQSSPKANPNLAAAVIDFLRRCDETKFAPAHPIAPGGAVTGACELIDRIETHRQRLLQAAPPPVPGGLPQAAS